METLETTPDLSLPPAAAPSEGSGSAYQVGTLRYTRAGLTNVFFWMLWGDLCLNVMESVIPRLVPLQLSQLGASDAVVGILTGTIFSLLNWVMNPIISTWSDRHRSPLGRRMPFLLYPSFFLAIALVLIGFSIPLAHHLLAWDPRLAKCAQLCTHWLPGVAQLPAVSQTAIGLFALTLVIYRFFDLFPQCVYYCLFPDVIPQAVIGRFVALFRVMATLGIVLFHYFLLQYATTHAQAIYCGCAALYLLSFVLLSLLVKEGKYPPPPPKTGAAFSPRAIWRWIRESFGTWFYWKFFLTFAIARWIYVPFNTFLILYAQRRIGLSTAAFGHLTALMLLVQVPTLLLIGPLLDRFHPTRLAIGAYGLMLAAGVVGFFFIHSRSTFVVVTSFLFLGLAALQGTMSTLAPRLLPRSRFGQFSAATAMVTEAAMAVLAWLCGSLLDRCGEQFLYLWVAAFACAGLAASAALFSAWLQQGGDSAYVAPAVD